MIMDLLNSIVGSRHWVVAGWTMLHFLWIGLAIALFTFILRRMMERARAEVRHAGVLICFVALVVAPIPIYRSVLENMPASQSERMVAPPAIAPGQFVTRSTGVESAGAIRSMQKASENQRPPLARVEAWFDGVARWMPLIWAAGAPFMLAMLIVGLLGAQRLRNCGQPLTGGEIKEKFDRLRRNMGVLRPVTLAICETVRSPMLVGIFKPVILLPGSLLTSLTPQQLELVFIHELAHIRRWDNLVNLLQRVAEGVLFFHPAVWIVSRWVRLEREHCCDAVVLRRSNRPRMYVETLASLAAPARSPRFAAAAMANHQLLSRVRKILNLEDPTMAISRKTFGLSLAGVLALLAVFAAMSFVVAGDVKGGGTAGPGDAPPAPAAPQATNQADPAGNLHAYPKPDSAVNRLRLISGRTLVGRAVEPKPIAHPRRVNGLPLVELPGANGQPREANRPWGPEQATGEPNVPEAADDGRAWASLSPDGQDEWLELRYSAPVEASEILIYETYNPGAVSAVIVTDDKGNNYRVFNGPDPSAGSTMAVLVVTIAKPMPIVGVRVELASMKVAGWNEIDAVGLVDAKTAKVSWAEAARASSTYAEQGQGVVVTPVPAADAEVERLRKENEELRRLLEEASRRQPI